MNTLMKAIVLSISTALVAAPAMAAPQQDQKHQVQSTHNQKAPSKQQQTKHQTQTPAKHQIQQTKKVDPSRDWRAGQKVPSQYHGNSYKVDHNTHHKLTKPGKNQQWIKVNGDYILTNVISHAIIKIIAG